MADLINDAIRASVARASRACAEMADDSADIDFSAYGMSTSEQALVRAHAKLIRQIADRLSDAGWLHAFCAEVGREYLVLDLCGHVVTAIVTHDGFKGSKSYLRVQPLYIKERSKK